MNIIQTNRFKSFVKKLNKKQKSELDNVIRILIEKPDIGEQKKGDLSEVFVFKFKLQNHLHLLAYKHDHDSLTLLMIGSHENFFRNLKK